MDSLRKERKRQLSSGSPLAFLDIGPDGTIGGNLEPCKKALFFDFAVPPNFFDWACDEDKGKISQGLIEASGSGTYGPKSFIFKFGNIVKSFQLLIFKGKGKKHQFRVYFLPGEEEENPYPLSQNKLMTLGTLAAGVAHDLNNMFTGMWTFLALIKHSSEEAKVLSYVDSIETSLKQAMDLTGNITRFMKEDSSAQIGEPSKYIAEMAKVLKYSIGGKVHLFLDLEEEEIPLQISPSGLGQIFLNIAGNAGDAVEGKGNIWVKTSYIKEKDLTFFVLEIEDDGPGISVKDHKKIFEPFFTTKDEKGTGLGLAIVKQLVEKAGGLVELFSQKGEGTRFVIFLPTI